MTSGIDILLVTDDHTTAETVESVLKESSDLVLSGVHKDVSDTRGYLSGKKAQLVIVDIDPDPSRILRDLGMIFHVSPETFVFVVCSSLTKKLVLEAMQAGARHFIEKKNLASELSEALRTLTEDGRKRAMGPHSAVVPVFSAGGGCGATTVAVNLCNELRLLTSEQVLAIDLDACYGNVSTYLGIKSQYGVADVLTPRKKVIDEHLIKSSAYAYKDDFHVLTSPASTESPGTKLLQYENLPRVLEACRQVYGYTVIDAPRLPGTTITELAGLSDIVLVVFQLTVKDVSSARSIVSFLAKSGIARERIVPVANRVRKRGPLVKFEDSKKALGLSSCQPIRSDWGKAMKSLNDGQLLAQAVRRSSLRKDFRRLAAKVRAHEMNGHRIA
jgi:pilus assembly protein CpaE